MSAQAARASTGAPGGAPDSAPLVTGEGITVRYGGSPVLERVDITVAPGEIVTLIGPNGSGKTTLIRVVLGLQTPDEGRVRPRAGIRIGYVPQRLSVDPVLPLTVRRFLQLSSRRTEAALQEVVAEVGGHALLDQQVHTLSGGELQRMALARALLREPHLLVLDEPLQGVDFHGQLQLFELIDKVRRVRDCGVLMVSHDLHLVMKGTDRVVCLNRHVCCSGKPDSVSRHPASLALFGPGAADSLAVYTPDHDHDHALSGEVVPLAPEEDANRATGAADPAPEGAAER
jgi:zinc transport system ATP-binding protein